MKRALLVLCLLGAAASAPGQEASEGERLIDRIRDKGLEPKKRADALRDLWSLAQGSAGVPPEGVAALIEVVQEADRSGDEKIKWLGLSACWTLASLGADAEPALPPLLDALRNPDNHYGKGKLKLDLGGAAEAAASKIGQALATRGDLAWWAVPYAYRTEGLFLLALLVLWFPGAASVRRRTSRHPTARLAFLAVVAGLPSFLTSAAVHHATTRGWAESFLPKTLTVVPLPTAAVLSVVFCCGLAAVWAELRGRRGLEPVLLHEPVEGGAGDP